MENTMGIAKRLQKAVGADIARIETVKPYTGSYDVIAVGTPTWWYTMAPAVLTFLKTYNRNGKTVIPFQAHGGWPGHVIKNMCAVTWRKLVN